MPFAAKVICDSLNPEGFRLTTFQVSWPRPIWSELMTHRALSKNASSSRAIPAKKLIQQVKDDPFIPIKFFYNESGMQTNKEMTPEDSEKAREAWLHARDVAVEQALSMLEMNLTKSLVNRVIEPWMWAHAVVSGTDWANFFALRFHEDAEANFQHMSDLMREAYVNSVPKALEFGEWHLPYILEQEYEEHPLTDLIKFSTARCARSSYMKHDNTNPVPADDFGLHSRLVERFPVHCSPTEHPAQAKPGRYGNFNGFRQYRQQIPNENVTVFPFAVPKYKWWDLRTQGVRK